MSRAKNLGNADITAIVEILDGWSGRLTWDALIDAVERHLFVRYTRQALHKHTRIQNAFALKKQSLVSTGGRQRKVASTPEMQAVQDKIARLQGQVERFEAENTRLLEQFARWAYNASIRGLDEAYLNSALPNVNRKRGAERRVGRLVAAVIKNE